MLSRILRYKTDIIKYNIEFKEGTKTIRIKMLPTSEPLITAPPDTKIQRLDEYVKQKVNYIKKQQKTIQEILTKKLKKEYKDDEVFYYLGEPYILKILDDDGSGERVIILTESRVINVYIKQKDNTKKIMKLLEEYFNKKAQIFLENEVNSIVENNEEFDFIDEIKINIKKTNKYWGKCKYIKKTENDDSSQNKYEFTLNEDLIHLSQKIIEYVIFNELSKQVFKANTKEHSAYLLKFVPNWEELKEQLDSSNFIIS